MAAMMMSLTAQANRWSSENRAMLASDMPGRDRGRAVLKTQDVGGRVTDQNGEPLGFVSVALLSADSTYIQGASSDENGAFMIQTTDACCILRLSFIGYRTQYVNVEGSDVGTIQMEEDLPLLSEIIVKGQMLKTKLTGNSMITTIQGTILGTSGSAKEMLAKVPGMTLKGAEYDAAISAVVRIKTIRREGDGFGFDLMAANNQNLTFGLTDPSSTLNLRYRHNSLDLFGMVNYWKWESPNDMWVDTKNNLTGRDLSHQDDYTHYPYNWQGNAYYNGQAGKLNIDWNVDFMTNKENGVQTTRSRSHRLDISIRYTFNASKSKYKGTGAGQAERQRMSGN